ARTRGGCIGDRSSTGAAPWDRRGGGSAFRIQPGRRRWQGYRPSCIPKEKGGGGRRERPSPFDDQLPPEGFTTAWSLAENSSGVICLRKSAEAICCTVANTSPVSGNSYQTRTSLECEASTICFMTALLVGATPTVLLSVIESATIWAASLEISHWMNLIASAWCWVFELTLKVSCMPVTVAGTPPSTAGKG